MNNIHNTSIHRIIACIIVVIYIIIHGHVKLFFIYNPYIVGRHDRNRTMIMKVLIFGLIFYQNVTEKRLSLTIELCVVDSTRKY